MGDYGKDIFAISFDMVNRKCVRLSDWGDALDEAAHNLATGGYYKVISKDIDLCSGFFRLLLYVRFKKGQRTFISGMTGLKSLSFYRDQNAFSIISS